MDINSQSRWTKYEHRCKMEREYAKAAWLFDRRLAQMERFQRKRIGVIRTKKELEQRAERLSIETLEEMVKFYETRSFTVNKYEWKLNLPPITTTEEFVFEAFRRLPKAMYRRILTEKYVKDMWLFDRRAARLERTLKKPIGVIRTVDELKEEAQSSSIGYLERTIVSIEYNSCRMAKLEWKNGLPPYESDDFSEKDSKSQEENKSTKINMWIRIKDKLKFIIYKKIFFKTFKCPIPFEEEDSTSLDDKKREKENKWKTIREKVKQIGKMIMRK